MAREAARIMLASQFPELRGQLSDYRAADVDASRKTVASLIEKYGVIPERE